MCPSQLIVAVGSSATIVNSMVTKTVSAKGIGGFGAAASQLMLVPALPEMAGAYTASKQAIEGFTGSLAHELGHFNVRAKPIEPGYAPTTRFAQNTSVRVEDLIPQAYADLAAPIFAGYARPVLTTREIDVAEAVWAAVHDGTGKLRFPAGADAVALTRCAMTAPCGLASRYRLRCGCQRRVGGYAGPAAVCPCRRFGAGDPGWAEAGEGYCHRHSSFRHTDHRSAVDLRLLARFPLL